MRTAASRQHRDPRAAPDATAGDGLLVHVSHGADDPRRLPMALRMAATVPGDEVDRSGPPPRSRREPAATTR